jgi:membrane protein YqaA with SNARE-associated domain
MWGGEAVCALLEMLLRRFRAWLDRTPRRGWHQIGWPDRTGRLLMIAIAFAVIGGPLCWLILR